jgi:membrane protein DedA with SNARE-associated domain
MLSDLLQPLIDLLHQFSEIMPLPWFAFVGAFVEEVIAPIPSPLVMTLAGSISATNDNPISYLFFLAFIGAVGKTIGSYIIYVLADKGEDVVMNKFGKLLGVSHREVEIIGKHLNKGWRDDFVLFLLRAVPIMPTAPVSIVCGLVKLNLRTYITSTFLGTMVRNIFYLYLGYTSLGALESVNEGIDSFEKIGYLVILITLGLAFAYIFYQRKNDAGLKFLDKK